MDQTEAQRLWIRALTTLDSLGDPSPTTKMLRARLFSCVATMLWRVGFSHSLGILHIDALEVAGFCSNEAASLGFISPTVLAVGGIMKGLIESPTEALNHRIQGWKRFALIFAAVDKRNKDLDRRESYHETKVMATPNAYQCAAPGCGIEATKKSGLLRCAGKCPLEFKPSYCSKECQKAVSRVPSYQTCHADDETRHTSTGKLIAQYASQVLPPRTSNKIMNKVLSTHLQSPLITRSLGAMVKNEPSLSLLLPVRRSR